MYDNIIDARLMLYEKVKNAVYMGNNSFWLGSAYNENNIFYIYRQGTSHDLYNPTYCHSTRPLIIITESSIPVQ